MDRKFEELVEGLHEKYQELMKMTPKQIDTVPRDCPIGGVYLFFEKGKPLYAGRTKRKIRYRLKDHVSTSKGCPFAWRITREITGNTTPSYRVTGSRASLLAEPSFRRVYEDAKNRIRRMDVRYVGESDPLRQALLEIYVAVVSRAKYNDFDTH